jgi:hypothetical protein
LIILQDDPSFDPMAAIPQFDVFNWDIDALFKGSQASSNKFSLFTPPVSQLTAISSQHTPGPNIAIPDSSNSIGNYPLPVDFGRPSSSFLRSLEDPGNMGEFEPFLDDRDPFDGIGFEIDENGNLIGIIDEDLELPPLPENEAPGPLMNSMQRATPKLAQEFRANQDDAFMNEDPLPNADAFPQPLKVRHSSLCSTPTLEASDSEMPPVPTRRRRRRKLLTMRDDVKHVAKSELREWSENYVKRMQQAKDQQKDIRIAKAKQNAEMLVWDRGIADVGTMYAATGFVHPLGEHFSGTLLKASILGLSPDEITEEPVKKTRGRRRRRSEAFAGDSDAEPKHARQRVDEDPEMGRNQELNTLDEYLNVSDEAAPEMGMEAQNQLDDRHSSSLMPWSRPASVIPGSSVKGHGSAQKTGLGPSPLFGQGSQRAVKSIECHSDQIDAFGSGPVTGAEGVLIASQGS